MVRNLTVGISENEKLLEIPKEFEEYNIEYYNAKEKPFKIYGVFWDDEDGFIRIPKSVASSEGVGIGDLYKMDAGGRLKFKTKSRFIALKAIYNSSHWFAPLMGQVGSCGFDLFAKNEGVGYDHVQTFIPMRNDGYGFQCVVDLYSEKERDLVVNFPIFAGVKELAIGICKGCKIKNGSEYYNKKPVVFYGSSITHGAYANRPGSNYPSILSERLNLNFINLGFSGACRAEKPVLDYINNIDMSAYILDYDYNARTEEYLEQTHYNAYKTIRDKHPNIPILMASRPNFDSPEYDSLKRRNIVKATFERAKKEGDKNVYFVDGKKEFSDFARTGCTVDYSHPNDAGFVRMANAFEKQIKKFYNELK